MQKEKNSRDRKFIKEVPVTEELRLMRYSDGPFKPEDLDETMVQQLLSLAGEAFPVYPASEVVEDDLLGRDMIYVLKKDEELVGAASRQLIQIEFQDQDLNLLYLSTASIFKEYRGKSLSRFFYFNVFDDVNPDVVSTTTKVPAIHRQFMRLAAAKGLIVAPDEFGDVSDELLHLGEAVLEQGGRDPSQLDNNLVRRGYLPGSQTEPYRGYEFFEKRLELNSADGCLLIAARPIILETLDTNK